MQFRWDKWVEGAIIAGLVAVGNLGFAWASDGITKTEIFTLIVTFVSGVVLYCKQHEPDLK